jgi:hypothetical protein
VSVNSASSDTPQRIELTLRKPPLGWYPRPTVVFDGRGHPAQWGTGTWQLSGDGPMTIKVFLFNRLWRFGSAEFTVERPMSLVYSAPWLPFLPGKLAAIP